MQSLFEKDDKGSYDLYGAIQRKIEGGLVIDNWIKIWTPLLGKTEFTAQEAQRLTLGTCLAKTSPEVHGVWKGNKLIATTIIEEWIEAIELFGEK